MKARSLISGVLLFLFTCLVLTGAAHSQANSGKAVLHFGGAYSKAQVDRAQSGFFGVDAFAGKMFTNNLCLGFYAGYDVVHTHSYDVIDEVTNEAGTFNETLAVIPFLVKAKYYMSLSTIFQVYGAVGGGVYRTVPTLGGNEVGSIDKAATCFGGSVSVGLDYWFLLTTGVGFEFEYHMFKVPEGDMFKYWQVRVDYSIIKF